MPQKLVVTGGLGFIGSNFIHHALKGGWPNPQSAPRCLVNIDKETYAGNPANLTDFKEDFRYQLLRADIGDRDKVAAMLQEIQPGGIVHFAAESHVDRSIDSPEPFIQTNVVGTLRLLDAALAYFKTLKEDQKKAFRFLHVSTDEVYGSLKPTDPSFTEDNPFRPNSPYAASKASSDHLVRAYGKTYGLPVLISNCSNNYGPYQFPEKLIPLMILNALDGKPLPIYGDGQQIRDWLYVRDHCRALITILEHGIPGNTYNVGGLCEKANIEIVDQIGGLLDRMQPREDGKSYLEQKTFVTDRPGHDRRYSVDCSKLSRETGWQPEENLTSGLEKTVAWYLRNLDWCRDIAERKYQRERLGLSPDAASTLPA